jgi:hypothetical protein
MSGSDTGPNFWFEDVSRARAPSHEQRRRGERRSGRRIATYVYRDHLGGNHTKIEKRRSSKAACAQYPQFFWSGGRWVSEKPKGWVKIPHRLQELLEALAKDPSTDVFLPEGEKDADTIRTLGLIATTNSEGASPLKAKVGKWAPELNKWFSGIGRLFILADNDDVGRDCARHSHRSIPGCARGRRRFLLAGRAWTQRGGTSSPLRSGRALAR